MTDLLQGLNPAQREAVTATEGFVRVVAGAGSGKTRALTHRFAYLVNELGILPGNILCVTFTNKSAGEMRQRIHALTGDNDTGYINTFHGFCVSILQEDSHAVQYPKRFLVLDNSDIDAMLQIIYEERGLTLRDMTFSAARDMIEIQKLFQRPDYYRDLTALSLDALKEKYDRAASPRGHHLLRLSVPGEEVLRPGLQRPDQILPVHLSGAPGHQAQVAAAAGVHHDRRVSGHRPAPV